MKLLKSTVLFIFIYVVFVAAANPYVREGPWVNIPLNSWVLLDNNTNYYISAFGRNWDMDFKSSIRYASNEYVSPQMHLENQSVGSECSKKKDKGKFCHRVSWITFHKETYKEFLRMLKYNKEHNIKNHSYDGTLQFYIEVQREFKNITKVKLFIDNSACYKLAAEIEAMDTVIATGCIKAKLAKV